MCKIIKRSIFAGFRFFKKTADNLFLGVSGMRNHVMPTVFRFDLIWPLLFFYMWNYQICSHYQGFVTHFRFTADEKFYPKKVFMGLGQKESFTVNHYFLFKYSSRRWLIHKKMSHNIISQLSEINKLLSEILLLSECTS